MLESELQNLVASIREAKCEGQRIEVKAARNGAPARLYDTLSAFSNQDAGGVILFGLDESADFSPVGVYDAQDLQHRVAEQCKQMEPPVRALFTVGLVDGKTVVSAEIPGADASERPVHYRGVGRIRGSWVRVGEADEPMSEIEIYGYEAFRRRIRDDLRPVEGARLDSLDSKSLFTYLEAVKRERPNVTTHMSDKEILESMGVTVGGVPSLAGVLLFAPFPQTFFPQLCVTAVVVPGAELGQTDADGARFSDNRRFVGPIPDMLRDACAFVSRNTKNATIVAADGRRKDRAEYPERAVREAVLNALLHRDYGILAENVPVRIECYADRLEIVNEGGLYGRGSVGDLGRIRPDTRNAALANMLEVLHETENRYSGIPTMLAECKANGQPPPEFFSRHGRFVVVFRPRGSAPTLAFDRKKPIPSILAFCRDPRSREELVAFTGYSRFYVMSRFVEPLLQTGELRRTLPDRPKSKLQRYLSVPI